MIRRLRRGPGPGGARHPRPGRRAPRARAGRGIREDQIIWIFGFARTGSSWLARMMTEPRGYAEWNEPQVGEMLGSFYYLRYPHRRNATFLLGDKHRDTWEEAVRHLVLSGAEARYPDAERIVVKEPHGSIGAPLLTGALPESRVVLLLRDPRDMVASALDAQRSGSWAVESRKGAGSAQGPTQADTDPDAFVRGRAERLVDHVTRAREAYDAHAGPRSFVRYERLREEPVPTLARIFAELGLDVDHAVVQGAVDAQAWEQIPAEDKGEGKRYRRAEPGGWSEDLTPAQARTVERITAPALGDLYG